MMDVKQLLLDSHGIDNFQRVSTTHPIEWFIGRDTDAKYALFCIVKTQPKYIGSSKVIHVFIGKRKDTRYGVTFSLLDNNYLEFFAYFCEDMINFTKSVNDINASKAICDRYIQWQLAFKKTKGQLLSFEEIKGLLGEMVFLKSKMFPKYGVETAIDSWTGGEKTIQDFYCNDTWYEIKATVSGSSSVKISSVEQLDASTDGHLIVVALDKTSETDASRLTLNNVYEIILEKIPTEEAKENFKNRLLAYGYVPLKEYDSFGFKYNGMTGYTVNKDFPCLRKNAIPSSVQKANYELSLPAITDFKERELL